MKFLKNVVFGRFTIFLSPSAAAGAGGVGLGGAEGRRGAEGGGAEGGCALSSSASRPLVFPWIFTCLLRCYHQQDSKVCSWYRARLQRLWYLGPNPMFHFYLLFKPVSK